MPLVLARRNYVAPGGSAPVWSGSQTDSALVGTSAAIDLAALCPTATSFSLQAGSLPAGRSIVGTNITGTYSNGGAVSYTIRATNVSGSTDRAFTGTITEIWDSLAEVDFTLDLNGSATLNIDLDTYAPGPTVPPLEYTVRAWPGTIAQSGARNNVVSGSVSATQAKTAYDVVATDGYVGGGGGDDFAARAAAASAFSTWRFPDAASVTDYIHPDGAASRISWDSTNKPPGAGGSIRYDVQAGDTTNSGNWKKYLHPSQTVYGNGSTYYIQWREYFDSIIMFVPHPGTLSGFAAGFKQINLAEFGYSNTNAEVVVQNLHQIGAPQVYHRDTGGSYPQVVTVIPSGPSYRWQNAVDNGGPDGTLEERLARYGPVYGMPENLNPAPNTLSGGLNYYAGEWMTFEVRVSLGNIGVSNGNSTVEMWAARDGVAPRKLVSATDLDIGAGTNVAGHDAVWFNAYCSDKTGGVAGVLLKSDVIIAPNPIQFPGGFSITPA